MAEPIDRASYCTNNHSHFISLLIKIKKKTERREETGSEHMRIWPRRTGEWVNEKQNKP